MKKYSRLFTYLAPLKGNIVLYVIFTILSIIFSIVSLGMLIPFLDLLFNPDKRVHELPSGGFNSGNLLQTLNFYLTKIIDAHGTAYALGAICIIIIISILLKNLFLYLTFYVLSPMRNLIMERLRNDLYNKILQLPIGYFTEQKKGDIISRMTNDTNELEGSVIGTMEGFIKDPINIIFILGSLAFLSPHLSLFLLVFLPLTGFIIGRVSRSLKKAGNQAAIKYGEALSTLDETLSGLRVIKAFNAEGILRNHFFKTNAALADIKTRMNYKRDLASPMSEFLGVLVLCGILYFGGRLILGGGDIGLTPSGFMAYIALFAQIINPAKSLSSSFYSMQKGTAAITRIEEILKANITVEDKVNGQQLTDFTDSIEFKNVRFGYEEITILDNINLRIAKGKTVALVGSSGAGKSTLADLVPRFHDATAGELLIDGLNIKEYSLASLRSQISIVTQEPILFNDTIANNISLGKPDATTEEIEHAAKVANAYNFIVAKDEGFNTNIGDRGSKLSGGERQRLTIARAVLKNPPILILDEATSSLDTESERLVQDAINNMMQNRTSIVIAHRLSTIRHADEIIVMQKGEIAERGTHDELLKKGGIYKRLVDMQEVR
ncbi:ABC transporter ATP-binding protein [Foetidibacter luteolus]|uniref:ABC transporter ATP-binding protein n=1 Tax=Foetidibacter luteolus TaxID=2608880 RepID=UPI00129BDAE2|nr:ABC transporter ATP-binding protein [Foetidibacter luteolus]